LVRAATGVLGTIGKVTMKRLAALAAGLALAVAGLAGCTLAASSPTVYPTLSLTGTGDQVLNLPLPAGEVAFAHITGGAPSSNFVVWADDANNNHLDLLVNTVDSYIGTVPVSFDKEPAARIGVTSSSPSPWTIVVLAVSAARHESGAFQGTGDDVIVTPVSPLQYHISGGAPSSNFIVWSYDGNGNALDLLVNTVDPYDGVVAVPPHHYIVVVTASSPWSVS
jgi:hypothetical protein